jgi:hypothetical protein
MIWAYIHKILSLAIKRRFMKSWHSLISYQLLQHVHTINWRRREKVVVACFNFLISHNCQIRPSLTGIRTVFIRSGIQIVNPCRNNGCLSWTFQAVRGFPNFCGTSSPSFWNKHLVTCPRFCYNLTLFAGKLVRLVRYALLSVIKQIIINGGKHTACKLFIN